MPQDETYYQSQVRRDVGDNGKSAVYDIVFPVTTTGGTWGLSVGIDGTTGLAYPIAAAAVQAALEGLVTVGAGNVRVTSRTNGFRTEFIGALATQPVAQPVADGSGLNPPGDIAVKEVEAGAYPYFTDARIAAMWARRDAFGDNLELRYLWTRYDAIVEFKGFAWTQIEQQTGDVRRNYQDQFAHLAQMETATLRDIEGYVSGEETAAASTRNQSLTGELVRKTPSGIAYPFPSARQRGWVR